jgi:hypothetical protein
VITRPGCHCVKVCFFFFYKHVFLNIESVMWNFYLLMLGMQYLIIEHTVLDVIDFWTPCL